MTVELAPRPVPQVWVGAPSRLSERLRAFRGVYVRQMESMTVWHIGYAELDKRITEIFGRPYRFLTGMDHRFKGNDTYHLIDMREWDVAHEFVWVPELVVSPDASEEDRDAAADAMLAEVMDRWDGSDSSPAPEVVLGVAIRDGLMPPGWYLIEVCW